MPRRIVIHAGFHKTGTSSVQQILRANRARLRPWLRSVLNGQMRELLQAARGYSTWRDPITLAKFAIRFQALLTGIGGMPKRALCLSAEELSGHLPGRGTLVDYAAAPVLANEMARIATKIHPDAELVFFYSTRDPQSWLRSAYWEHVKSSSMTLGWEDFARRFGGANDLDAIARQIARTHRVRHCRLEDTAQLPAAPLLELCGVPMDVQRDLPPLPVANRRCDDAVLLALLAANRDYPDRDARKAAKRAILDAARENPSD
jgi:hypothetical protein